MESLSFLDITIKYFNAIVFILCVVFAVTSFFASWVAWREIRAKKNIVRSILAAYNIIDESLEKSGSIRGPRPIDQGVVQSVFFSVQEILNAMYGEITGKPIPVREEEDKNTFASESSSQSYARGKQTRVDQTLVGLPDEPDDHPPAIHAG
jgi:hypothetical protein